MSRKSSRELLNKLNDLYEKIVKYQDMSILNIIPNPGDIIKGYNNYISAKFRYDEKMAALQSINMGESGLTNLNRAIVSVKSDNECIPSRVKPQRGSGKQSAGSIFNWFSTKMHPTDHDMSIEDKIEELERQQKYLEQTPIQSININLREEYNTYVDAIKKYKTTLRSASKSNDTGGTNVLTLVNDYIEIIRELEKLNCAQNKTSLEYPLIDLERKIGESVKKIRTQTAQVSSISPNVKKYMDEIKELNKKLRTADAEKAQLSAKVAKYGIDTMRKSAVSSAVKVGKIKDLLKVAKQVDLAPGEVQIIYNPNTGKTRDPNTGKETLIPRGFNVVNGTGTGIGTGIGQPQTASATPFQNFGSASVQLSSPNPLLSVSGSSHLPIEAQINFQKSLINMMEWKPIIENLKLKTHADLQKFLNSNIDSSYKSTVYYTNVYTNGFNATADEAAIAVMLLNNGSKSIKDIKDSLKITEVPIGTGTNTKTETKKPLSDAEKAAKKALIDLAKLSWNNNTDYPKGGELENSINKMVNTNSGIIGKRTKRGRGTGFDDYFYQI